MTTKYFLLTKQDKDPIDNDERNQIIFLGGYLTVILPQVNIDYYLRHGLFEKNLIEWCKQFCAKDKVFLDIGAHTGTYALCLADYCQHVHAFEPQKMTYYALCGGVALSNKDNITCHNIGLGSTKQCGQKTLKIVSNDGGGSTIQSVNNVLREETIVVETLDHMNLNNIGFIKMDVEENEYHVFLGASRTLEKSGYPVIIFESNKENDQLFQYITQLSYKIINIKGCNNMFLACH